MNLTYDEYKLTTIEMHEMDNGEHIRWGITFCVTFYKEGNVAFYQRYSTDPSMLDSIHVDLPIEQIDALRLYVGCLDELVGTLL